VQEPSTATLPPDLRQLVDDWLEIERQTDALLGPLDDEQFNWCPPGAWSIGQCLDHLNTMNTVYLDRIKTAISAAKAAGYARHGPISPTWWGRKFIASQEPPVRMKFKTPRRMRPASRKLKAEVWPEFVRLHGQLRTIVTLDALHVDLNKASFPNPFVPAITMRAGTALCALAAHERRHLAQAHHVRTMAGFPRS
jgi:hypothetical protein